MSLRVGAVEDCRQASGTARYGREAGRDTVRLLSTLLVSCSADCVSETGWSTMRVGTS